MTTIKLPTGTFDYDPSKPLGRPGGFGQVFAGKSASGGEVAVKKLHLSAADAAHRELRIADELKGRSFEHVVPFIDAGEDVIVEKRGYNEDDQFELAFCRICDGANALRQRLPFELVMTPKAANSAGLQLADLLARPVGIKVLRPDQPNRAYDILEGKFRRSPAGKIEGWGLKIFP